MRRVVLLAVALGICLPVYSDETARLEIYNDHYVLDDLAYQNLEELKKAIVVAGRRGYSLVLKGKVDSDRTESVVRVITELYPDVNIVAGGYLSVDGS